MRCSQSHLQMKYVHQTRHIKHYWWQQKVPSCGSSPSHFWQNCQTCFIISARSYESEGRPTWFFYLFSYLKKKVSAAFLQTRCWSRDLYVFSGWQGNEVNLCEDVNCQRLHASGDFPALRSHQLFLIRALQFIYIFIYISYSIALRSPTLPDPSTSLFLLGHHLVVKWARFKWNRWNLNGDMFSMLLSS